MPNENEELNEQQFIDSTMADNFQEIANVPASEVDGGFFDAFGFVVGNMKDAIFLVDGKGVIKFANQSAAQLAEKDQQDIIGMRMREIVPLVAKNDNLVDLFIDLFEDKGVHDVLADYQRVDGSIRKLRVSMSLAVPNAHVKKKHAIVLLTDITDFVRVNSAFERYTSPEIADRVLNVQGGDALGGEKREVTILMSDLRGSTALGARMEVQDLVMMLNHYFTAMAHVIAVHHGVILEFLGDGIFVVFGAPADNPNHAADAVACAIEMQKTMEEVNAYNAENGFPELNMGIGVNTGEVVVGNIGSQDKTKYACIGNAVNIAGRVESFTVGGQIYISEFTRDRISEELSITGSHRFMPKGAKDEVEIYSVDGIGGAYNLSCAVDASVDMVELSPTPEVRLHVLVEKKVLEDAIGARVLKLSKSHALLDVSPQLPAMVNVVLEADGDLYAKIMKVDADGTLICFTSKPEGFDGWYEKLTADAS